MPPRASQLDALAYLSRKAQKSTAEQERLQNFVIDPIEYELELPNTQNCDRIAKTVGRILKHTYEATRVRIERTEQIITITAKVRKEQLSAIRGAVKMTCMARGVVAELHRHGEADNQSPQSDSNGGVCTARAPLSD